MKRLNSVRQAAVAAAFWLAAAWIAQAQTLRPVAPVAAGSATYHDMAPFIAAGMASSGNVVLPCGKYLLATTLIVGGDNQSFHGVDASCVTIQTNMPEGDVISIPNRAHVSIGNFQFQTLVKRTSGAVIHGIADNDLRIHDINGFDGTHSIVDGILLDGGTEFSQVESVFLARATGDCLRLSGKTVGITLNKVTTYQCRNGIRIQSASGVYASALDIEASTGNGVRVDPAAADDVNAIYFANALSDTSSKENWAFVCNDGEAMADCGPITESFINGAWAGGAGSTNMFTPNQALTEASAGFYLRNPKIDVFTANAVTVNYNGGHGVDIRNGNNIVFGGGSAINCNSAVASGASSGIYVGPTANHVKIALSLSGEGGQQFINGHCKNKQAYGLDREAGKAGITFTVIGMTFTGNLNPAGYVIHSVQGDHIVDLGNTVD